MPTPRVIHQPTTHKAMQKGIQTLVDAIRPTLGPVPRRTLMTKNVTSHLELLDDGGTIARRVVQIPNRSEDMGAMLLRQLLWKMHEEMGDGTATTAVIFETVYNEGLRYLAAGANSMRLRQALNQALPVLLDELAAQSRPIEGKDALAQVAHSVCHEEDLAAVLGEIMDIVGEYGQVDIRQGKGRGFEHGYVEGMYWKGGIQSREMINNTERLTAELENPAILITDAAIQDPRELVHVMKMAFQAEVTKLLLVVKSISDGGLSVLNSDKIKEKIETVAVKLDLYTDADTTAAREDLFVLTGARPILRAAGQSLEKVTPADFGRARWSWANRQNFGISGGKGDPRRLREHVATLRRAYRNATDKEIKQTLLERIGKLLGGSATLQVGGVTDSEIQQRKDTAQRAVNTLRAALSDGVIPGGGLALLQCRARLHECAQSAETEEQRMAYKILLTVTEAPIRNMLANAGHDPSTVMAKLSIAGDGHGYDILKDCIVTVDDTEVWDVTAVQQQALSRAVGSAALALTVDVMVQHRNPSTETEP